MQRGGDVIFVPHLFGHGTYTVQESVGIAVEVGSMFGGWSGAGGPVPGSGFVGVL